METKVGRHRRLIAEALNEQGFTAQEWTTDEDGDVCAKLGRFSPTEDIESESLYAESEGDLEASVAGSEEYSNERVCFIWKEDHTDGTEITRLDVLEAL